MRAAAARPRVLGCICARAQRASTRFCFPGCLPRAGRRTLRFLAPPPPPPPRRAPPPPAPHARRSAAPPLAPAAAHLFPPKEARLGQKFLVDATLYCGRGGLLTAGCSDDLAASVDYARVYEGIAQARAAWGRGRGAPVHLTPHAARGTCGSLSPSRNIHALSSRGSFPDCLSPAHNPSPPLARPVSSTLNPQPPTPNPRGTRQVMEGPPFKLLEAAAHAICERVLGDQARVAAVRVHVRKPHVALRGPLESVGARAPSFPRPSLLCDALASPLTRFGLVFCGTFFSAGRGGFRGGRCDLGRWASARPPAGLPPARPLGGKGVRPARLCWRLKEAAPRGRDRPPRSCGATHPQRSQGATPSPSPPLPNPQASRSSGAAWDEAGLARLQTQSTAGVLLPKARRALPPSCWRGKESSAGRALAPWGERGAQRSARARHHRRGARVEGAAAKGGGAV